MKAFDDKQGSYGREEIKLNRRQRRFIQEYLIDLNASQAAVRAGYSKRTAYSQGQRLLKNVEVQGMLEEAQADLAKRAKIKQGQVIIEEKCIAFSDIRQLFTRDGRLLMPHELPENVRRAVASVEIKRLPGGGIKHKYKLLDKGKSLERLSRILGIYNDKLRVGVSLEDVLRGLPPKFADEVRAALKQGLTK